MLFERLECFLAVARLGSVSRAAEEMYLTQPTLTARIKALEEELGGQLFVRTSRGMRLTEAGKEFLPHAERSLRSFEEGRRSLEELRGASGGRLVLGASPGVGTYALPAMLEQFVEAHPNVAVSVKTGHSEDVLGMVLEEEVQVGLCREVSHAETESIPLYEDELVLVVYPEHPFAGRGSAGLDEIGRERLIFFDHTSGYYELTRSVFREAGLRESRAMELDNIEAAKRMVERRLGIAFLPRTAVSRSVAAGHLRTVGVEDGPALLRPIVALKRRDIPPTAAVGAFLEIARGMGERPGGERFSPALAASFESLQLIDLFS